MSENLVERCAVCGQADDHPKFHLLGPSANGLGWTSMHHDCAASQGHLHASLIVQATEGAKGEELRSLLTDPDHEVHAIVQKAIDDFHAASQEKSE